MDIKHSLQWSLINHINLSLPELQEVVWIYDGIKLSDRVKPFVSVEEMQGNGRAITAGRETYEDIYRFQVGLRCNNPSERSRLSEKLKATLRQPRIPLFDTGVSPEQEVGFFYCSVTNEQPIPVESTESETDRHRVYFDVEIEIYRERNSMIAFTQ